MNMISIHRMVLILIQIYLLEQSGIIFPFLMNWYVIHHKLQRKLTVYNNYQLLLVSLTPSNGLESHSLLKFFLTLPSFFLTDLPTFSTSFVIDLTITSIGSVEESSISASTFKDSDGDGCLLAVPDSVHPNPSYSNSCEITLL